MVCDYVKRGSKKVVIMVIYLEVNGPGRYYLFIHFYLYLFFFAQTIALPWYHIPEMSGLLTILRPSGWPRFGDTFGVAGWWLFC